MLQKIRHATDSIVFRLFLGILVLSFGIWGVSDVLKGTSANAVATFSDVGPITYEDFAKIRAMQVKQAQQESEQPLSEEQIKSMGIDQFVVQNLVTNKLFEFLAYKFDMDFSNAVIADFIRRLNVFSNDNKEFDINKFKSFLHSNNMSEEEYSDNIRNVLSRDIIMSSLVGNAYIPSIRTNNIISYMSEIRAVDVATMSLLPKADKMPKKDFKDEELLNFYKENSHMFKTDEVRDICYAKLNDNAAKANIKIMDTEVQSYFNANKDEFGGKNFDKVKASIKSKLQKQKSTEWIIATVKSLEDEVAGGATLQEIADKYSLKKICEQNINTSNIETRADGLFTNYISEISELRENEVSYPLELSNESGQILIEITRLEPEQIPKFDLVQDKVSIAYRNFLYKQETLKRLQDFASKASESNFSKEVTSMGMSLSPRKDYIRANLTQNVQFPPEMLANMFAAPQGKVMGPFITDNNAYIFIVHSIGYDKKTKEKITKDAENNIKNKLREGIFEELMIYTKNKSNMKLNTNFSVE